MIWDADCLVFFKLIMDVDILCALSIIIALFLSIFQMLAENSQSCTLFFLTYSRHYSPPGDFALVAHIMAS